MISSQMLWNMGTGLLLFIELCRLGLKVVVRYTWTPGLPKVKKNKKHIACIGDSITFGAGVMAHRNRDSYPAMLQKTVGEEYQVLNYGLSGRTLMANGDVPYTREKHYLETFRTKMDYYICMLGTNDSKPYNWNEEDYQKEMTEFLSKYKIFNPNGRVVVMIPPCTFPVKGKEEIAYDIQNDVILQEKEILQEIVNTLDIQMIDLYTYTKDYPEWFPDGVHPNAVGNRNIAEYIAKEIF
ncbi:MAG: GDSL-type esterase/lipase family protein [Lachnospiraceae bacterium]|nr:GDSL-type esterase/lipase family protein [Lachnospiraceae bacterium]